MSLLWGREGVGWAPAFHPVPGRGWPPLWRRGRVFDPASACVCVGPTCETVGAPPDVSVRGAHGPGQTRSPGSLRGPGPQAWLSVCTENRLEWV